MSDERAIVRSSPQQSEYTRPAGVTDSPWRENAHAVVIGINEYSDPKIPNLRFARADAEAVYAVFTDPAVGRFRPENVTLLVDSQATERNIRSALGTNLPRRAGKDATVLIYYAGHGAPVIDPRSKSTDGLEKYLVPHDALVDDLRASAVSMDAVQQYFSWLDANQVICFLDSCYSGTAGGRSFDHPAFQTRAILSDEFLDSLGSEGRFVVTACGTNEVSLESPKVGHGIFTQHLVEGLGGAADADGDGKVTIDELYEYVYRNVEKDARALGGSMNPVKKGSVRGRIYLTQYETKTQVRIRQALGDAAAAVARGETSAALALYQEVLSLDAGNTSAREGTAAIEDASAELATEVRRKERILLEYVNSGELAMAHYNRALSVFDDDGGSLTAKDTHYRRFVDSLVAGELSIRSFLRSVELLESASGQRPPVARPPAQPVPNTRRPDVPAAMTHAPVPPRVEPSPRDAPQAPNLVISSRAHVAGSARGHVLMTWLIAALAAPVGYFSYAWFSYLWAGNRLGATGYLAVSINGLVSVYLIGVLGCLPLYLLLRRRPSALRAAGALIGVGLTLTFSGAYLTSVYWWSILLTRALSGIAAAEIFRRRLAGDLTAEKSPHSIPESVAEDREVRSNEKPKLLGTRRRRLTIAWLVGPLSASAAFAVICLGLASVSGAARPPFIREVLYSPNAFLAAELFATAAVYLFAAILGLPAYVLLRLRGPVGPFAIRGIGVALGVLMTAATIRFGGFLPWWVGPLCGLASAEGFYRILSAGPERPN